MSGMREPLQQSNTHCKNSERCIREGDDWNQGRWIWSILLYWGGFSDQLEKSLPMIPDSREQHFIADTWQRGYSLGDVSKMLVLCIGLTQNPIVYDLSKVVLIYFFIRKTKRCFLICFKFTYFYWDRKGGRKRGRETSMCNRYSNWLPLLHLQLGTRPTTQACALTSDPSVRMPALNPLNPTSRVTVLEYRNEVRCIRVSSFHFCCCW